MLWCAGVSVLCLFVCLPFFLHYKRALHYRIAASFKSMGTLCAAAMALTAAVKLDPVCWVCFAALILHAAADWVLEFSLPVGGGLFLIGHLCYIAFFTGLFPPGTVHLICSVCLLGILAFLFWRWRSRIGKQMPLFAVYGAVLSVMCACAVSGLTGHTTQGQLIAAAGALFFLSDTMLFCRLLFSAGRWADWAVMIAYYGAQLLIGFSCLLI